MRPMKGRISVTNKKVKPDHNKTNSVFETQSEAEVLYQRLGTEWYAYTVVNEEVFHAKIDPKLLEKKTK